MSRKNGECDAVRKNYEFDRRYIEMMDRIREISGLKTETSVMEEALVLFAWATSEAAKGHAIGAYDDERNVLREITSPALQRARSWSVSPQLMAAS